MRFRALFRAAFLLSLVLCMNPARSTVRATVDNTSVGADGTIELLLEHDGQTPAEPDLSPLKQDFDVLSSSRSSNVQIINGSMTSSVRLELSLSPKHSGQVRIPTLSWAGEKSEPIDVNVGGTSSGNSATRAAGTGPAAVYLKTSVEPQHPYVQAAVDLTVRLYAAAPLYHAQLEFPAGNDVLVQQVGADRSETVVENGQRYQVIERRYELFPQRSGALSLAGPVLSAQIAVQDRNNPFGSSSKDLLGNLPFNNAFTSTRPIEVHSDEIKLDVQPRPAAAGNEYWLPAGKVTLEGEWRPAQGSVKVGDPVTLDLHLKAEGLTAAQLPDLNSLLRLPDGVKAYPDQAKLTNDTQGNILVGHRDQSIALIADRAGDFTLPILSVRWWDIKSNQARDATLPARTLTFAPAEKPSTQIPAPAPPAVVTIPASNPALMAPADQNAKSVNPYWFWASIGLGALWVLTLIAWFFTRRRPPERPAEIHENPRGSVAEARSRFRDACRRNDAGAARAGLLEWIGAAHPAKRPVSLRSFAETADAGSARLLKDLDRACYGGGSWQGADLLRAFDQLPARRVSDRVPREVLGPLYK